MAQRTAGVRRHNAVRFSREAGAETAALTRLEFSRSVLQRGLGFAPSELNCVVKLPGPRDVFEVSFKNPQVLESFWNLYRGKKDSMPLSDFVVDALTDREIKIITIQFYNEAVAEHNAEVWLRRHCEILSNFTSLCKTAKKRCQNIIVSGPLPTLHRGDKAFSRLSSLKSWLTSWCTSNNLVFVNNWDCFWERPGLYRRDGLHPSWRGALM
ncbi:ZCHC3 protein, partial [Amia calva]|nr:ZCHC3 protein [Amia calva]